ncbi:hypothetical protein B0H13DRAFT_2317781 [Mycena leptocephala]|nr:hypothetical protein B0H13DRAFT_2317781 [Mycena leptocephala]
MKIGLISGLPSSASSSWQRRATVMGGGKRGKLWDNAGGGSAEGGAAGQQRRHLGLILLTFYSGPVSPAPPPPSALALGVRSMQSSPLPVLRSRCPAHARCFYYTRARTCALTSDSYRSRTSRSVSASGASLPPFAQPTHALTLVHASPLQVLPVIMHSCAIRSSRRAGTHALDLAPLAPYASRIDPNLDLTLCTSVPRAHHPSQ